jgi:phage gp29-like protein
MGIIQSLRGILGLAESPIDDASQTKQVSIHVEETGTSGTEIYAGYYSEEYLNNLRGKEAADLWDKMRRSDARIKMVLSAVKNPIKGAQWSVEPGSKDDESYELHAELVEQVLFKDLCQSWTQQISETLTCLEFGFSVFEKIDKLVQNHSKFGSYHSIAKLAWRSPRTIERWNLDPVGNIVSVSQYAYGDLGRVIDIPGEFLVIFSLDKEGDNYEGVSALRACYGPWFRKNSYLKLMAVGMEKFAIPTPYMEVPEGKEGTQQYLNAKKVLEKYVSHQQQYITIPAGWKLNFASPANFDPEKIRKVINEENTEIAQAFLENFLELGQSGGGGSYALGTDLSDFFLGGIQHIADMICEVYNRKIIPDLIKMNFGPQDVYPELKCTGIKDKAGKEFAEIIKILSDGKVITPDTDLEANLRERFGLPKKVEAPNISLLPAPNTTPNIANLSEFKLADKPKTPKALMTLKTEELKDLMKTMLGDIGSQVIQDLMSKKKKATPSQYLSITNQVEPKGSRDYKEDLKTFLSQVSIEAINQVKKEIPGGTQVKLSEKLKSIQLSDFSKLPPSIQKAIESQVGLLTAFQIQDLLKALYFQFNSSVGSTDSDALLEDDLQTTLSQFLEGASVAAGAGNTVSKMVNEGRSEFFFDEDVYDEIESFTFVNGDPVSPICQDLAGTVFSKDDPDMGRYSPPLHHNAVLTGTLIQTMEGLRTIENITVGDLVLTHLGNWKPVTEWMDRFEDKEYFTIELENGKKIDITAEHPVLTQRGWKRVDELLFTDELVCQEDLANA